MYQMLHSDNMKEQSKLRIKSGKFIGIEFYIGEVSIKETPNGPVCSYIYDIELGLDRVVLKSDKEEFEVLVNKIVDDVLSKAYADTVAKPN